MRAFVRGIIVRAKGAIRWVLQLPAVRTFIGRLAAVAGARAPLTSPAAAMFGEGAPPERRLLEVEAERDALVEEIADLKQQIAELRKAKSR